MGMTWEKFDHDKVTRLLLDHLVADWRDVLPRIHIPTWVVTGRLSPYYDVEGMEWFAAEGGLPSLLRPRSQLRRREPARLVRRRQTLAPATDQGLRRPCPTTLGRHHRLAHLPCIQRPSGGDELARPSRQGTPRRHGGEARG